MATIRWKGAQVAAKAAAAAQIGITETMADCVHDAAADHPDFPPASRPYERYANRTGVETGAIRANPVKQEGSKVSGTWGAYTEYALFLEVGTSRIGATAVERTEAAGGNMDAITPPVYPEGVSGPGWGGFNQPPEPGVERTGPLMAPRPFLRPSADRNYPHLPARIAKAFKEQG